MRNKCCRLWIVMCYSSRWQWLFVFLIVVSLRLHLGRGFTDVKFVCVINVVACASSCVTRVLFLIRRLLTCVVLLRLLHVRNCGKFFYKVAFLLLFTFIVVLGDVLKFLSRFKMAAWFIGVYLTSTFIFFFVPVYRSGSFFFFVALYIYFYFAI